MKYAKWLLIAGFLGVLAGCAAIGTAVSHSDLQTQTLMSDSIFLPANATRVHKTVFVEVHNTTDKQSLSIEPGLKASLRNKGFAVVNNPSQAYFVLQVNMLQMGRNSETAAKEMMGAGYGGALEGVVAGGAIASIASANVAAGGLVGGVATSVADNMVQNVTYSGIVDLQLTLNDGKKQVYKTRILTIANRVNLKFDEAAPSIERGLIGAISGILG